jgi:flavin reductase (DIM6/NTAB) family NADH-FMN oxidoreductase RutF
MDAAARKLVLRMVSDGLYAVTARSGEAVGAMTANWITQSSFDPPLVALAVQSDSHSCRVIDASRAFAVNVYDSGQRDLAGQLGMKWARHPEKLDGLAIRCGPATGSPLLAETLGWVECRVLSRHPSGDHTLFLAEVVEAGINREGAPLTLREAGYKYAG